MFTAGSITDDSHVCWLSVSIPSNKWIITHTAHTYVYKPLSSYIKHHIYSYMYVTAEMLNRTCFKWPTKIILKNTFIEGIKETLCRSTFRWSLMQFAEIKPRKSMGSLRRKSIRGSQSCPFATALGWVMPMLQLWSVNNVEQWVFCLSLSWHYDLQVVYCYLLIPIRINAVL